MTISQLLQQSEQHNHLIIPEGWGQGRATFGGLIAGLLYSHLVAKLAAQYAEKQGEDSGDRVLRSATISFIGAVTAGEVSFEAEIFRNGKSVTQASARLVQDGEVKALLLASFGSARVSAIHVAPLHCAPEFKRPDAIPPFPYIAGVMPEFLQQSDMRWVEGGVPFSGAAEPDFGGWMRWRESFPVMTVAHLIGLIDSWPPSVFSMLKTPASGSTLCWTIELLAHTYSQSSENFWQYQVKTDYAESGYVHAEAHIWDDTGTLVAISRQTSTIFA